MRKGQEPKRVVSRYHRTGDLAMGDYFVKEHLASKVGLSVAEIDRLEGSGVIRPVVKGGQRYYSARDAYKARFVKFLLTERKMGWDEAVERASSQVLYDVSAL